MSTAGRWLAVIAVAAALGLLTCAEKSDDDFDVSVSNITQRVTSTTSAYISFDYAVQNAKPEEAGVVYSTSASKLNRQSIEAYKSSNSSNTQEFGVYSRGAGEMWTFDADLINLADNTTYYYKPYVIIDKSDGTRVVNGYYVPGNAEFQEFTTGKDNNPAVAIGDVGGISRTGATFTGTVIKSGTPAYTEKGFCYGTIKNPVKGNSTVKDVSGTTSAFSLTVSGLIENETYYVSAYIENESGTQYSEAKEFKTLAGTLPSVSIGDVAVVSGTSATFSATVLKAGDPEYTEKGFCYGTMRNPAKGSGTVKAVIGTATAFSLTVSDLKNLTNYYVRAYIDNGSTVQYSEEKEFTTPFTHDGKTYKVATFGDRIWMVEDFKGGNKITGLYTWSEAMANSPEGWVLPSNNDWNVLRNVLGSNITTYFPSDGYWSATASSSNRVFVCQPNYYGYDLNINYPSYSVFLFDYGQDNNLAVRYIKDN
jgi:hypothetical protein